MKRRVIVAPNARQQLRETKNWWRKYRASSSTNVGTMFENAVALISKNPGIGAPYEDEQVPKARRVPLRNTPYHVYYVQAEDDDKIYVLAVWSSMRGGGPDLRIP